MNMGGTIFPLHAIVKDADDSRHFNDLLYSTAYTPWTLSYGPFTRGASPMTIGGQITCMRCGKHPIYNSDAFICQQCALEDKYFERDWVQTCDCCGKRFISDVLEASNYDPILCLECLNDEWDEED